MTKPELRVVPEQAPPTVQQQIENWAPEFLACRSLQHSWEQTDARYSKKWRYYAVEFQCSRCTTVRHQELNERGQITISWYDYPEGYLSIAGFVDADSRGQIRLANLKAHDVYTEKVGVKPRGKPRGTKG